MPAVPINSKEDYFKVIEVLDRVGGTWQWVAEGEKRYLLASPRQYEALLAAKAIEPEKNGKDSKRGKRSRKSSKS